MWPSPNIWTLFWPLRLHDVGSDYQDFFCYSKILGIAARCLTLWLTNLKSIFGVIGPAIWSFYCHIFTYTLASWSHLFFRPKFQSDFLMEYLENYDAICFSDQNSDPTFKWNTWRIMMPSAFPIRIPIRLSIGIQVPSALCSYFIQCYLEGKKNQNENIRCVGFVTADLGWNFSVIWYLGPFLLQLLLEFRVSILIQNINVR